MIPLKLTVKNFMCYRDGVPPLDLESIHIACLCGDNGHGKTALLDAITWALWGQARARTQDELVHLGRQDMAVDLEFFARDQRYRVSRRYSRPSGRRQGAALLELYVISDNGLRPITGNTLRETEARIREILHMDYDTFVNTAFLLQGRADLFTNSKPAERKEVLAEVLDLSYYQALEGRAKEEARAISDKMNEKESAIELRRQEVARKPELEEWLTSTKEALQRISPEADAQHREVERLRETVDSLVGRRQELESLSSRLVTIREELSDLERQTQSHQHKVSDYEEVLHSEADIRRGFTQIQEGRSDLERLNQALAVKSGLEGERAPLEREVALRKQHLTSQVGELQRRITQDLEPSAGRLPETEEALRAASVEREGLQELDKGIQRHRGEAEGISVRIRHLEEGRASLKLGMEDTRKKFDMLDERGAKCPLCNHPLGAEGQQHLRIEYEALGQKAKEEHQEMESELGGLTPQHEKLSTEIAQKDADFNQQRQQLEARIAALQQQLAEAQRGRDGLGPARAELNEIESRLQAGEFAEEEQRRLSELGEQISALDYDSVRHQQSQERVRALDRFDELHRKLLEARDELPREREALEAVQQMHTRRREEVAEDEGRRVLWQRELEDLPSLEGQLADRKSAYEESARKREDALVQERHLTQRLDELAEVQTQLHKLEEERAGLVDERHIYDELSVAFGNNGIQALIIEQAIPQLQNDANELLGRLTDNRMFLKLQLQEGRRERRLGLPSEELDIKISDEVGTRSYETFSGGEAFRINFALRIALSKLLARRSGAPLPILFIDEGFGSQDTAGQERLKEAIQSIQPDFRKIIVITHVEEVKNSFPTRIEVSKTPSGSTFVVV